MLAGKGSGLMACRNALSLDFEFEINHFWTGLHIDFTNVIQPTWNRIKKINGKLTNLASIALHDQKTVTQVMNGITYPGFTKTYSEK